MTKKIVILYHADCADGFGGAWAAYKKFGNKADYISVRHQESPPEGLVDKEIFMIDFTYPEQIIKELIKNNKKVTSIDHHETAEEATKITQNYSYAVDNSGSVLAWKYFHLEKPIPKLLKHVEDMDLWKFKIPKTEEVFAYLQVFNFDFKIWNKISADLDDLKRRKSLIEKGKLILQYENRLVDRLSEENAELVEFEGYKVLAVNSPNFHSQIGNKLYEKMPPFGIVWREKDGKWVISLRSDGGVHVGELAKKYGGGGHRGAAAFKIPYEKGLPWKFLNY